MKSLSMFLASILLISVLSGCNSGTMRGVGEDVERVGEKIQD